MNKHKSQKRIGRKILGVVCIAITLLVLVSYFSVFRATSDLPVEYGVVETGGSSSAPESVENETLDGEEDANSVPAPELEVSPKPTPEPEYSEKETGLDTPPVASLPDDPSIGSNDITSDGIPEDGEDLLEDGEDLLEDGEDLLEEGEELPEDELDLIDLSGLGPRLFSAQDAAATEAREPAHRKYVQPNGDGSYTLSLEVTGDREEVSYPADVVIIFDVSYSTSNAMMESFKLAAKTLADTLLTNANAALPEDKQTRIAIVTFAQTAKLHGAFTADRATLEGYINTIGSHDGEMRTNWTAALEYSDALLTQAAALRPDTRKYMLFQTDGATQNKSQEYLSYAEAENRATQVVMNGITLYTLGVLEKNNQGSVFMPYIKMTAGQGASFTASDYTLTETPGFELATKALAIRAYRFAGMEEAADGKYFIINKESEQEYINAFNQIAKEISDQIDYTNIVITDTLSDYATLLNQVGPTGAILDSTVEKIHEGVSSAVGSYSVSYHQATKTITFTIDEALAHQTIYRLTVAIAPSQQAYDELAANRQAQANPGQGGYPHVGEENTGDSSAGQAGFFSNTQATLTYHTVDKQGAIGNMETASPFEKPVIQLELSTLTVQKEWRQDTEANRPASIQIVLKQDGADYRSATLDATGGWATLFENIPSGPDGHVYTIEEIAVEGYDIVYAPESITCNGLAAQSGGFTVTNTLQVSTFEFRKVSSEYYHDGQVAMDALDGAEFELYQWNGQAPPGNTELVTPDSIAQGQWTLLDTAFSENGGMVSFTVPAPSSKHYQLVETRAPENFQLPTGQWRVSFTPQGELDAAAIERIPGADGAQPPFLEVMQSGDFAGELTLVNVPYYEMPEMGGHGKWPFVWAGAAMLAAGMLVWLVYQAQTRKRRMQRLLHATLTKRRRL